jgi:hypothetical protein
VQHIRYAYVHQADGVAIHNVLPAGPVATVVFLVFAELHVVTILHCAEHGAVTETLVVAMTHTTLRLNQHTLVAA